MLACWCGGVLDGVLADALAGRLAADVVNMKTSNVNNNDNNNNNNNNNDNNNSNNNKKKKKKNIQE